MKGAKPLSTAVLGEAARTMVIGCARYVEEAGPLVSAADGVRALYPHTKVVVIVIDDRAPDKTVMGSTVPPDQVPTVLAAALADARKAEENEKKGGSKS